MTTPVPSAAAATGAPAGQPTNLAELKKAGQQFEAVFLRQMLGSMRQASLGDGILDTSATEQFRDMSDAKTAETMAGKGVLGVADLLVKQFGARLAGAAGAATDKAGDAK